MISSPNPNGELLVIGYGNTLRQDDQAGPVVAERIESLAMPHVRTMVCAQLSPEHAEAVAGAAVVVFVDAQARAGGPALLQQLQAGESSQVTTHAAEPRTLLALARDVYGHAPVAWLLTVPAEQFGFGEAISLVTRQGIEAAVEAIVTLARIRRLVHADSRWSAAGEMDRRASVC